MSKLLNNILKYTIIGIILAFPVTAILDPLAKGGGAAFLFVAIILAIMGSLYGATKEENFERSDYVEKGNNTKNIVDKNRDVNEKDKSIIKILKLIFKGSTWYRF